MAEINFQSQSGAAVRASPLPVTFGCFLLCSQISVRCSLSHCSRLSPCIEKVNVSYVGKVFVLPPLHKLDAKLVLLQQARQLLHNRWGSLHCLICPVGVSFPKEPSLIVGRALAWHPTSYTKCISLCNHMWPVETEKIGNNNYFYQIW